MVGPVVVLSVAGLKVVEPVMAAVAVGKSVVAVDAAVVMCNIMISVIAMICLLKDRAEMIWPMNEILSLKHFVFTKLSMSIFICDFIIVPIVKTDSNMFNETEGVGFVDSFPLAEAFVLHTSTSCLILVVCVV